MKKLIIIFTSILCLAAEVKSQTAADVLRYSFTQIPGTARSLGMGGAFGSAGADLSAASINPAGLGLYRRNEVMGSMAISSFGANANYNGFEDSDSRTSFNLPNFGMVFNQTDRYKGKDATEGLVSGSLAFGFNRTNNFQQNNVISGVVNNSSRANGIAQDAKGLDSTSFWSEDYDNNLAALAWRLRLIDNDNSSNSYASQFQLQNDTNYAVQQLLNHRKRGKTNEYYVSGGINISNFLYLGASVIINDIDYTSDHVYSENTLKQSGNNVISQFTITDYFRTSGSGVGGRFGAIVRPVDFLRLGVAYQTPIRHNLVDYYQKTLSLDYNGTTYTENIPGREDMFEYQLITPGRITISGTAVVGRVLLINADYEMVNYSDGKLASRGFVFNRENTFAKTNFNRAANNIRVGAEYNHKGIKLRGGYAIYDTPYNTTLYKSNSGSRTAITGGLGATINKNIFIDLSVVSWVGKSYETLYSNAPHTAIIDTKQFNFVLGGGLKF